jgi:hypothetical protein
MGKINAAKIGKGIITFTKKNAPKILSFVGVFMAGAAVASAIPATKKAMELIEEEKLSEGVDKLSAADTIKTVWKCYIPTAMLFGASASCFAGSNVISEKRTSALASAYAMSKGALQTYTEKVVETVGEKKEAEIRDSIAKDKLEQNPIQNNQIIFTDKGNTLCYDSISGRYFKSDIDKLKKSVNELNRMMTIHSYITLNDFYYEIGLDNIKIGDEFGWDIDSGLIDLKFSSNLTPNGEPCLVVDYEVKHKYDTYL